MTDRTHHIPCRCYRTLFKYKKTIGYNEDKQIITVKYQRHNNPMNSTIDKTEFNDEKLNREWLNYKWYHLCNKS